MVKVAQSQHNTVDWRFFNSPEDVQWLKDTHLARLLTTVPEFASFALEGTATAPYRVTLYTEVLPLVMTEPLMVVGFPTVRGR